MSLNQILLIGRAGRDPELRYMEDGSPVTNFSLAVNSNRPDPTNQGEWIEDTEWFNVSVWGRQAESTNQYLTKGRKIFVEGRLFSREYTNAAGETRQSLEVRAFRVIVLDRRESESGDSNDYGNDIRTSSETSDNNQNIDNQDNGDTVEELPW
ncbi:MAG: single-stranded DNA-binding protein [Chloroflexi bacterium]|nr:single-stranded DNA-binding protein [Chloroflexota bacterium]